MSTTAPLLEAFEASFVVVSESFTSFATEGLFAAAAFFDVALDLTILFWK